MSCDLHKGDGERLSIFPSFQYITTLLVITVDPIFPLERARETACSFALWKIFCCVVLEVQHTVSQ